MINMQLTCFRLLERPSFIPFLESELTQHTHKGPDTLAHRKLKEEQEEKASACKATPSGPSKVVTSQDNTVHLFMGCTRCLREERKSVPCHIGVS